MVHCSAKTSLNTILAKAKIPGQISPQWRFGLRSGHRPLIFCEFVDAPDLTLAEGYREDFGTPRSAHKYRKFFCQVGAMSIHQGSVSIIDSFAPMRRHPHDIGEPHTHHVCRLNLSASWWWWIGRTRVWVFTPALLYLAVSSTTSTSSAYEQLRA